MRFLFVHQNCPGQYVHYVRHLLARDGHEVFFLTAPNGNEIPGLRKVNYLPQAASTPGIHPDAVDFESGMIRARSAHEGATALGLCPVPQRQNGRLGRRSRKAGCRA